MKELAQLPTPTIATRTFSSVRPTPFVLPFAPLLSLMKFEVLLDRAEWLKTHPRPSWLQVLRLAAVAWAPEASSESSFRTCHTRWNTVKMVSAAIT